MVCPSGGKINGPVSESDDAVELEQIGKAVFENWKWAWTTDIEEDEKKAIALLRERIQDVCA